MKILTDEQKEWLRAMPSWSFHDCNGEAIIDRCAAVEEQYAFDVDIPLSEQREYIKRLQEERRSWDKTSVPTLELLTMESPFREPELGMIPEHGTWADADKSFGWLLFACGASMFLTFIGIAVLIVAIGWAV